jgi:phosphoribosylaminoimidazole-succinocarboxamide synthase
MEKKEIIHDGVSIKIWGTEDPGKVIIGFTDDITAFYKIKKAVIKDKGIYCNGVSCIVSRRLQEAGIPTHFIKQLSPREQLCQKAEVIPMEVIVRNVVAGSLAMRLGLEEGLKPASPIIDLCYKSDALGDPLINDYQALALNIVGKEDLDSIYAMTRKINDTLVPFFQNVGITLVDFKIEFGHLPDGTLAMSDDITPDSARFWDMETGERLDKDRFRHDRGRVGEAYKAVYERLMGKYNADRRNS